MKTKTNWKQPALYSIKSTKIEEELLLHVFLLLTIWCFHQCPGCIIRTLHGSHRGWLLKQLSGCKRWDTMCQGKCISRRLTENYKNVGEVVTNTTQLAPCPCCPFTWSYPICGELVSSAAWLKLARRWTHWQSVTWSFIVCSSSYSPYLHGDRFPMTSCSDLKLYCWKDNG